MLILLNVIRIGIRRSSYHQNQEWMEILFFPVFYILNFRVIIECINDLHSTIVFIYNAKKKYKEILL